ncbi:SDR family oxidoreductase [soil metagenome]
MTAKTIVVTGASDGIGRAAAQRFRDDGHRVAIVGRSPEKTAAVAAELKVDYFIADFTRLDNVRSLASVLLERYERIDVLANNAGGIMGPRELTVDGHEKTLQVNHLAPFLLTQLLLVRLEANAATVIATSSAGNRLFGNIDVNDLENARDYSATKAYGDAKLANILFTRELAARTTLRAAAFHPGVIATNFAAESSSAMRLLYATGLKRLLRSADTGADTLVWLAETDAWPNGGYFSKRSIAQANAQAYDDSLAKAVWEQSATMVGL